MASFSGHLEIEHKFLVGPAFDADAFARAALALGPARTTQVSVRDTYFVTEHHPGLIFRHRLDVERQELTLKSWRAADSEARLEVNLRLDQAHGDQGDAVAAFLAPFGVRWRGALHKEIRVFYFADCEVVYYVARAGERTLRCVEFEALGHGGDVEAARSVLARYEQRLGFGGAERARASLFDLMLAPAMDAALAPG